ncbi:hypothetical protein GIB67_038381 [Kingdonia uniflora]|uniref:RNase H type-1 domain-containing protein n=1 Tax=Kingdonia uniflora TaxID=39325 RepID=A0A7J7NPI1_9MAGN|nr:hypothetical protein GIB67_038381 [Kingdonia uniflora]
MWLVMMTWGIWERETTNHFFLTSTYVVEIWGWAMQGWSHDFMFGGAKRKSPEVKTCYWDLPEEEVVKANCDGASRGNSGKGGYGIVFRDSQSDLKGVLVHGLGTVSSYIA